MFQDCSHRQNDVIKRYFISQIKPFVPQQIVLDDFIANRNIKDNHKKEQLDKEETLNHEENMQLYIHL